ncbi:hypothetical protein F0L74_07725 [Chitinophaga agrisoli]|uniref:Uncharacterized protein n=1 Tax=Chitinophaga agrisoli TaxID=2607653 RepID=A0A5B2VW59_9BACT|nr:hypothetical protein [Chitinophaga agrisoli]KAA2242426.1 hypothetical protein F0L74_07725 [Chitinophaga agrisoli]
MNSIKAGWIIIICAVLCGACKDRRPPVAYTVDIWDAHSSRAYSMDYHISNDSLSVSFIDGLVGGHDSVLLRRNLTAVERAEMEDYLSSMNIDTLRAEYINHAVEDGNQKGVRLQIGTKDKTILLSNVYLEEMKGLFNVINNVIGDKRYKIWYEKEVIPDFPRNTKM